MLHRVRFSELFLVLGFLGTIFGVPAVQIALELAHGQRVQFADLFRYPPTLANLRRYETALESQSWVRQQVRPAVQRCLFAGLRDTGSQALLGTGHWLFYRPGVRYLIKGDRPDAPDASAWWVAPADTPNRRQAAMQAVLEFRGRLQERGIALVVMPVPEKSSVYPDRLTRRADPQTFRSPTEDFLDDLQRAGVEVIDLFALFRQRRSTAEPVYLSGDTHWTPEGARLAAEAVAERIRQGGWLPEFPRQYQSASIEVARRGDLVEMIRVPGIEDYSPPQTVECRQISDKIVGLLAPQAGDREGTFMNSHLKDTPLEPTVLLLGDSFSRIYQVAEPRSLGAMVDGSPPAGTAASGGTPATKRLLPGSAGFPSLLAHALQTPVDYIISDGGAATDVRCRLSVNSEILENKQVVIWEFTERDLDLGRAGWQSVPLPPKL